MSRPSLSLLLVPALLTLSAAPGAAERFQPKAKKPPGITARASKKKRPKKPRRPLRPRPGEAGGTAVASPAEDVRAEDDSWRPWGSFMDPDSYPAADPAGSPELLEDPDLAAWDTWEPPEETPEPAEDDEEEDEEEEDDAEADAEDDDETAILTYDLDGGPTPEALDGLLRLYEAAE